MNGKEIEEVYREGVRDGVNIVLNCLKIKIPELFNNVQDILELQLASKDEVQQ